MGSSRYPGKPLANIMGLPMVEHVRRRTELCSGVDEVIVATCDQEIVDLVTGFGGKAVMTAKAHERCTERVEEATRSLAGGIVAIVQGDEPLLLPEAVENVIAPLIEDHSIVCSNLLSTIENDADFNDRNIVKAAVDQTGRIMFFSRAAIPYFRVSGECPIFRQTGIWALRVEFLRKYVSLPETPFERVESIDMFRVLEHGFSIYGVPMDYSTVGVDNIEDVVKIEDIINKNRAQKALHERIMER